MRSSVFVVGDPKGMPRARSAFGKRGDDGARHAYCFTPTTANGWRYPVTLALGKIAAELGVPISGACRVDLCFYFERPKTHWKHGKEYKVLKESAPVYHETKPDVDNLSKLIMDCASNAAIWVDDRLVSIVNVTKKWATHEPPGCLVCIDTEVGPTTVGELYAKELLDLEKYPRKAPGTVFCLPGSINVAKHSI